MNNNRLEEKRNGGKKKELLYYIKNQAIRGRYFANYFVYLYIIRKIDYHLTDYFLNKLKTHLLTFLTFSK